MQLMRNICLPFLLAHMTTFGLRVISNGLGLPVYGDAEKTVNYALLASDQKAALPSQVLVLKIINI